MKCHGCHWRWYVILVFVLIPVGRIECEWWNSARLARHWGVLENWADYCSIKWNSWCGGTPACSLQLFQDLLALDTMVLMWVIQDRLASKWRPRSLKVVMRWSGLGQLELRVSEWVSEQCFTSPPTQYRFPSSHDLRVTDHCRPDFSLERTGPLPTL